MDPTGRNDCKSITARASGMFRRAFCFTAAKKAAKLSNA
jgi:hypothetical protein